VETVEQLAVEYASAELAVVLGQDALEDLPNWRQPARLVELARLGVAARGSGAVPGREQLDRLLPGLGDRVAWIEMPHIGVSGTEIRSRAAAGKSVRYMVPEAVWAYMQRQRLYG
jgi:nicotinate-nucleotide adenylyltransferase